jgi:hypothetical protein
VTRETTASSVRPGHDGRNGHASTCWPARPAPLLPRTMPRTGPGPVKPPAASSTRRTGLMRPRQVAGRPVRRELRVRDTAGTGPWLPLCQAPGNGADVTGLARMSRPKHTRLDRHRRRPADAGRAIGVSGDAGGAQARGAVGVSDRPGGGPVPGPARAFARDARRPAAGRADGTSTPGDSARQPLSDQDRAAIRQAGAEDARRSRAGQGFPERIEDPAAVAVLAALLRDACPPPRTETGRRTSKPAA